MMIMDLEDNEDTSLNHLDLHIPFAYRDIQMIL